jgi:hypothetical protein
MKAKIKTIITTLGVMMFVALNVPVVASAASFNQCNSQGTFFMTTWYANLCDKSGTTIASPVANAKGGTTKSTESSLTSWLAILALNIVQILLSVVGYVSLGYIIYGGFKYMTQGDNSSGTAGARKTIQNAVIGLVIAIMSVAIISFISNRI